MTKTQIKDFLLKYKMAIGLTIITALLFFSNYVSFLSIIACIVIGLLYITCDFSEILCITMYLELFSGVKTVFIISLLEGLVVVTARYIYDVYRKRKKIFVGPLVLTLIFIVLFGLYGLFVGDLDSNGALQGTLIIAFLVVSYLVFAYRKSLDIKKCFRYLLYGIIVSIVLCGVVTLLPNYKFLVKWYDGIYYRYRMFTMHVNHLSILCLFELSYLIYALFRKKEKLWYIILGALVASVAGFSTLSKAFSLIYVFMLAYLVFYYVLKYKLKSLKIVLPSIGIIALLVLIFNDYIQVIYTRFFIYKDYESFIGKITTGRSEIWASYIDAIRSSISQMLMGCGLFSKDLNNVGSHNVAIFILYRIGFVGIILLGLLVYSYYKNKACKIQIRYSNILLLSVFLLLSLEEMILSERFFYFLLFGLMLLVKDREKGVRPKRKLSRKAKKARKERLKLARQNKEIDDDVDDSLDDELDEFEEDLEENDLLEEDLELEQEEQVKPEVNKQEPKVRKKKFIDSI